MIEKEFSNYLSQIPQEKERKFLILKPTNDQMENLKIISKSRITQTYLQKVSPNVERRVREIYDENT